MPARLNNGSFVDYGLGWDLVRDCRGKVCEVHHGGAIEGFRSIIVRYLCVRLSVIVLFNGELEPWKNNDFARDVADLVVGRKPGQGRAPGFEAGRRRAGRTRH